MVFVLFVEGNHQGSMCFQYTEVMPLDMPVWYASTDCWKETKDVGNALSYKWELLSAKSTHLLGWWPTTVWSLSIWGLEFMLIRHLSCMSSIDLPIFSCLDSAKSTTFWPLFSCPYWAIPAVIVLWAWWKF